MSNSALRTAHEVESLSGASSYEWTWPVVPREDLHPDQTSTASG